MTPVEILRRRQLNQRLIASEFTQPAEVVAWLGAMQAQEYAHAKWAINLRLKNATTDALIEEAFNRGEILRTHVLRPTWHFVAPADIRWLLALTAPHVHRLNSYTARQHSLDASLCLRGLKVIVKALTGGQHLTRTELQSALARAKINVSGLALAYIVMHAELEGVICSGPRVGKQFTYALLDERVPAAKSLARDEALAALATRYFISRGPATARDFAYWSGLSLKDARAGVASLSAAFTRETIDGEDFIFKGSSVNSTKALLRTFVLPDYDECGMAYQDRRALFPAKRLVPPASKNGESYHVFVVSGKVAGTWTKTTKGKTISLHTNPFVALKPAETKSLARAVAAYCEFSAGR
ncbi:winged helix DNA-binding domain-containing protein [Oleiharenicola lentus]|uniref:winged helix DNA-binding domain-containing protein n=1 Tax=Oleiharenicola lentus TaxID=2508720 RepID=UPI003F671088